MVHLSFIPRGNWGCQWNQDLFPEFAEKKCFDKDALFLFCADCIVHGAVHYMITVMTLYIYIMPCSVFTAHVY